MMIHHSNFKKLWLKEVNCLILFTQILSKYLESTQLQVFGIMDEFKLQLYLHLVEATDISGIASLSETKTFRIEEDVKPELVYCDPVAR